MTMKTQSCHTPQYLQHLDGASRLSQRKSDLGIPLPYTWLNPSTRPRTGLSDLPIVAWEVERYECTKGRYRGNVDRTVVPILLDNNFNLDRDA